MSILTTPEESAGWVGVGQEEEAFAVPWNRFTYPPNIKKQSSDPPMLLSWWQPAWLTINWSVSSWLPFPSFRYYIFPYFYFSSWVLHCYWSHLCTSPSVCKFTFLIFVCTFSQPFCTSWEFSMQVESGLLSWALAPWIQAAEPWGEGRVIGDNRAGVTCCIEYTFFQKWIVVSSSFFLFF